MNDTTIPPGLCSTCGQAPRCAYLRIGQHHVLHCEGFELAVAITEPDTATIATPAPSSVPTATPIAERELPVDAPGAKETRREAPRTAHGRLLADLEDIQRTYGYLPETALRHVAERSGRTLAEIYGVATFYKAFSLKPRGQHLVSVCLGTACHVRGGPSILDAFQTRLGVEAGETTSDQTFSLERVNCVGACALGPMVMVDGTSFPKVERSRVDTILRKARKGLDTELTGDDPRLIPLSVSCPRCNHTLMDPKNPIDGHPSVRVTVSFEDRHAPLYLCSLYGRYAVVSEEPLPPNAELAYFCPHCHTELNSATPCPACNARMVPMIVRGGGTVQICAREGCKVHLLDLG